MGQIASITDTDFAQTLQAEEPVLVDFWAEWCMPCRAMAPALEKLADEFKGQISFVKLDVQNNPDTPASLGVMNIPTLVLFRAGEEIKRFSGTMPAKRLAKQLQEALA